MTTTKSFNKQLGKNIKIARIIKELKQSELAKLTHVTVNYISLIETGRKTPSIPMLCKIANALEANIDELLKIKNN